MALNYVTLILDLYDGQGNPALAGEALLIPSAQLTDTADNMLITQAAVPGVFGPSGFPNVKLLATDNSNLAPPGWAWGITFTGVPGNPAGFSFFLPFSGGTPQYLSSLAPVFSVTTMAAYMPLSGGQFTGSVEPAVVTLTDAATITPDASKGNLFRVTLGGNRTLASPVNGTDGQLIRVEVTQDGSGSRTLAYGAGYDFGAGGTPVLSTGPGKRDTLGFGYDATAGKWDCLAFANGY